MSLLYLALAGLSISAAQPAKPERTIDYKADSANAPVSTNAYAFLEKTSQVADYIDGVFSPAAMNPPVFHDYSQTTIGNVVAISFNEMSVPIDISEDSKWENGPNSCEAGPRKAKSRRLLVICGPRDRERQTSSIFEYEPGRGITGFFAPCFIDKTCWFQLQSEKGLLATLRSLPQNSN